MPSKRVRYLQAALLIILVAFAAVKLAGMWGGVRHDLLSLTPRWPLVGASCFLVCITYAILIDAWRRLLTGWHGLSFLTAARIWTVSNLGRYVPGKVWQIGALMVMAREQGMPAATAGGSAVLSTMVATLSGFVVAVITGARVLRLSPVVTVIVAALVVGIIAFPQVFPWLGVVAGRIVKREIVLPRFAPSRIAYAFVASMVAWLVFGLAFHLFVRALVPGARPAPLADIAAFVGSYIIGFLAIFAPGGLIVREAVLTTALTNAGLASGAAVVVAVASRVWLTALEILPALAFLLVSAVRRGRRSPPPVRESHPVS